MYILRGINIRLIWAFAWKAVLCHIAWTSLLRPQLRKTNVWENHYATNITNKIIHTSTPEEQFQLNIRNYSDNLLSPEEFEHIKSFPFPPHYGFFSTAFVYLFNFLMPFALLGELAKFNENAHWMVIPFSTLIY